MQNNKNLNISVVFLIVIIMMYLFNKISNETFIKLFVLKSTSIFEIFPWRFFTYVFYFPENIFFFFFTVIIFFTFATNLESLWGSFHFSIFLLITIISRSIATLFFGGIFPIADKMTLFTSMMIAFGFNFPYERMYLFFFIPIRIKILAIISLVIVAVRIAFSLFLPPSDNYFGGFILLPQNISVFIVNLLSHSSLLIYFNKIFGKEVFLKIFNRIKTDAGNIENYYKKKNTEKENMDILGTEMKKVRTENFEKIEYDKQNNTLLCPEVDFNENDLYCISCSNFKKCHQRKINNL